MRVDLRYSGHSGLRELASGSELSFAPNLARPKVFFDAELVSPLRFREAISALHGVVVGDLKFHARDKSAYLAWKAQQEADEAALRKAITEQETQAELARLGTEPEPAGLEPEFRKMHGLYWKARRKWAAELSAHDPALFRALVPCDPVVTVAPDVVAFECFSKDESCYGCLSVDRGAFRNTGATGLGTTNVDYSLALYEHFQTLRSYRPTRLLVDPSGFEVRAGSGLREEKIDLPASWLRGFGQLQAAMMLPAERVSLAPEALYSVLSLLRRRREKTGPRSLKFILTPGKSATLVVEPWGTEIAGRGAPYTGPKPLEIKVWGRRRLLALARVLPLVESVEVQLLGTGMPSIWVLRMGEMSFVLALSGWTANDFTSGTNLDAAFAGASPSAALMEQIRFQLEERRSASLPELLANGLTRAETMAALHTLAKRGQVMYDFVTAQYRFRPILPEELGEQTLGPPPPEQAQGIRLASGVVIQRQEPLELGKRLYVARVQETTCEAVIDSDGQLSRARCSCSFFFKNRLRSGPCRHLLALRLHSQGFSSISPGNA
ncbi:MAG TPA: SWIM zinc finger family protein [Polyangiaceae bacterium]|nr:SWIM zinc finger family protein [Polyangiaceae bacterium]